MLEKLFKIRLNAYMFIQSPDSSTYAHPNCIQAEPIRLSELDSAKHGTVNLLLIEGHALLILNVDKCLGYHICVQCEARIRNINHYSRHVKRCLMKFRNFGKEPKEKYHSGQLFQPIMEPLAEIEKYCNVKFPEHIKQVHYLAVWDLEAMFDDYEKPKLRGKQTKALSKLHVLVAACASNIPQYTECKQFWKTDGNDYFKKFIAFLIEMSLEQQRLLKIQLQEVYNVLERRLNLAKTNQNSYGIKLFTDLTLKLDKFINRLVVLSFNGSKFDAKLAREMLLNSLFEHYNYNLKAVKTTMKDGKYMSIRTPNLLFLEQLNFLPNAKCSYDKWIQDVLGQRLKMKLPYSWITSKEIHQKLAHPALPEYEEWHSDLKGHNVLNVDYEAYKEYIDSGTPEDIALKNLGLLRPPVPGRQLLEEMQREFVERGFKTFKNYIACYLEGKILYFN